MTALMWRELQRQAWSQLADFRFLVAVHESSPDEFGYSAVYIESPPDTQEGV